MAALVRRFTDVQWLGLGQIVGADFAYIDQNTFLAVNADDGGTWAPSSIITLGGQGAWAAGPWRISNGFVQTPAASGKRIVLGDNDHIQLKAGSTQRSVTRHASGQAFITLADWMAGNSDADFSRPGGQVGGLEKRGLPFSIPLNFDAVHDGATLTAVVVTFVVSGIRAAVPMMPRFRVVAVDVDGNITPLTLGDAVGFRNFAPRPASAAAWYNGEVAQTFSLTIKPDVVIDVGKYSYVFEGIDESGPDSGSGNKFTDVACTFDVSDLRPQ
jgi:hypothetical protein